MIKQVSNTIELNVGGLIVTTLLATSLSLISFVCLLLYLDGQSFDGLHKNNQQTSEQNNVTEFKLKKVKCDAVLNKQEADCETYAETEVDSLKANFFERFDYQSNKFIMHDFNAIYIVKA
jgi:5'-3' exonuclease